MLICVWALEQDPAFNGKGSARRAKRGTVPISTLATPTAPTSAETTLETGVDTLRLNETADSQDVFVPWSLQGPSLPKKKKAYPPAKGERVRSNPKVDGRLASQSLASTDSPTEEKPVEDVSAVVVPEKASFNRYYHLFRHFELSDLVRQAAQSIGASYIDHSGSTIAVSVGDEAEVSFGKREGGRLEVELKEETWERENWVVEIGVRWIEM